jgi:squalene-hopene/tetraprenyl-beta-curcumene cyclase
VTRLVELRTLRSQCDFALIIWIVSLSLAVSGCTRSRDSSQPEKPSSRVSPQESVDQFGSQNRWNARAAAAYLDQRETWWMSWSTAARDHGTYCVACHTSLPYLMAEPSLRQALGEGQISPTEQALLANVTKRVLSWDSVMPYYDDEQYGDKKGKESRSTEAVLNALILANRDSQDGRLRDETKVAFRNLWSLQITEGDDCGAWLWQQFSLYPWESRGAIYSGAAWAALAAGSAPEHYQDRPEVQEHLRNLRKYLVKDYSEQSLLNKTYLLWASTKLTDLLNPVQQQDIIKEILRDQQSDGGWNFSGLTWSWSGLRLNSMVRRWRRTDWTKQSENSDGLATGLLIVVLRQAGVSREDEHIRRGLRWLANNQEKQSGMWVASSLNRRRDPSSNVGLFMSDSATAFAAFALSQDALDRTVQETVALHQQN